MKVTLSLFASALLCVCATTALQAQPIIDSWFTANSGKYARIYTTDANRLVDNSVTTWSKGAISQSQPAYASVQAIYSSDNWVYLRTSGLGGHVMGPWLNGSFQNVPKNMKALYRIPRTPTVPVNKTRTANGPIGYFVDGVAMFDSRDAFYWNGASEVSGAGSWNRDAYVNEAFTFDPAFAHQPGNGQYHYHANSPALRHLLGDHVDFDPVTKLYAESTNAVTQHSPIIGWVRDGYPVYGPYGFADATNAASGVRRMISGHVLRNGNNGTDNLTNTGRTAIPAWAVRAGEAQMAGPAISSYPLGRYMEDNAYLGDLTNSATGQPYQLGVDFDLNEHNVRWCVTPEFPAGTWAYFTCIASNGTPVFPYNIGRTFWGNPTGNNVASVAEVVTTNFVGGASSDLMLAPPAVSNSVITLTWSATEGGTYRVETTADLATWTTNASGITAVMDRGTVTTSETPPKQFFRVARTALATYDP